MIGRNILSMIFGFILGYFVIKSLYSKVTHHGPNSNEIKKQIFYNEVDQHCYRFIPKSYVCPLYLLKN